MKKRMLTIINARHTQTAFRMLEVTEHLRYLSGLAYPQEGEKSRTNGINVVDESGSAEQKTFAQIEGPLNHRLG